MLDRDKKESNSVNNTVEDTYEGERMMKVLWKFTVEDGHKWGND